LTPLGVSGASVMVPFVTDGLRLSDPPIPPGDPPSNPDPDDPTPIEEPPTPIPVPSDVPPEPLRA